MRVSLGALNGALGATTGTAVRGEALVPGDADTDADGDAVAAGADAVVVRGVG